MTFSGGCHCQNLKVTFATEIAPDAIDVRRCQCSFCRRHDQRSVTDPGGRVELAIADPALVSRYRFGLGTCAFYICSRCGVYVAAVLEDGGQAWATVNVNALDERDRFGPGRPVSFEGEDAASRVDRRKVKWTPARVA